MTSHRLLLAMPRFAANLSMLYPELPFLDRFAAAAHDGFAAVECQFPYAWPAAESAKRLADAGLEQVLINTPVGENDRGLACLPGREAEFRSALLLALEYAQVMKCPRIHAMAGVAGWDKRSASQQSGVEPSAVETLGCASLIPTYGAAYDTFVDNLRWAAEQAGKAGVTLVIEPINTRDVPGYFLNRQDEAHAIVEAIGSPHLKVMMDLYHCQIVEGDLAMKLRQYVPAGNVGHIQIAGVPDRTEPDRGEVDHDYLFGLIDRLGWNGWIGCEYRPAEGMAPGGTSRGLEWLRRRKSGL